MVKVTLEEASVARTRRRAVGRGGLAREGGKGVGHVLETRDVMGVRESISWA